MELSSEDRWAIVQTIAMHGHLFDNGELDRLDELFTPDVAYDLTEVGQGVLHGIAAVRDAAVGLGDDNPLAHHVTNTVITEVGEDVVHTRCKAIAVRRDGSCGTATYLDELRRRDGRWRISRRRVHPHRVPLGGAHRRGDG